MISFAPDGRVAILDSESTTFGQFDSAGNWHEGKIPTADEYMDDFGPLESPTLRALYLSFARVQPATSYAIEGARLRTDVISFSSSSNAKGFTKWASKPASPARAMSMPRP